MNNSAVGTIRDLDDAACDQDDRQMALINHGRRLFERIEEVAYDPEAVITLARKGQDNQAASRQEEELDKAINQKRREASKSWARAQKRKEKTA